MGTCVTNNATATAATRPRIRPIMMPVSVPPPDFAVDLRLLRAIAITFAWAPIHPAAPTRYPIPAGWHRPGAGAPVAVGRRPPTPVRRYTTRGSRRRSHAARMPSGGGPVLVPPRPVWPGIRQDVAVVRIQWVQQVC